MRKHVTPVDPKASIPDPDRGGFLPPEGRDVPWTPYWAGMSARKEISVDDAQDEPTAVRSDAPAPVEPADEPHEAPAPIEPAEGQHEAHPDA